MAESFADVADLIARWRPLTPAEQETAETLLSDASAVLVSQCPNLWDRIVPVPPSTDPELNPTIPKMIVCAMVKRAMLVGAAAPAGAVNAVQQSAGPFSQSVTYANPAGDLYLTRLERRALGCGPNQVAFTVPMGSVSAPVHTIWCSIRTDAGSCSCGASIAGAPLYGIG